MADWFVIRRADGSERKVAGYKYAAPKPGAKKFQAKKLGASRGGLPARVDLRPLMTAVENQGDTNSCVANAVAGAYEYLVKQHREDDAYDVSRMFIYYNARLETGDESEDSGSIIQAAIEGLKNHGACSEETWPFDEDQVNDEPSAEAYEEGSQFLVEDVSLVEKNLESWKAALAEGHPIVFGISLFESFDRQRRKGMVPMPSPRESSRESHGGHAMLAVGYSDKDQVFIVRNSWGEGWGDKGYCYIPYDYLMDDRFNDGDSWIIRQIEPPDVNLDEYSDDEDEAGVIGDLDSELANIDDEAWGELTDALGDVVLETRIAVLFLVGAAADGELSDEELEAIGEHLAPVLEAVSSPLSAEKVLRHASRKVERNDAIVEETVELFGEHLPNIVLAGIIAGLRDIIERDGANKDEREFLNALITAWQVSPEEERAFEEEWDEDEEDSDSEEDEDDEEDDDEEDDDEEDEDEEDEDEEDDEEDDDEEDEDEA